MGSVAGLSKINGAEKEKTPKIHPSQRCDVLSTYLFICDACNDAVSTYDVT